MRVKEAEKRMLARIQSAHLFACVEAVSWDGVLALCLGKPGRYICVTPRASVLETMLCVHIGVESVLEGRVSAVSAQAGITINTELDKRVDALYDHVAAQVGLVAASVCRWQ